MEIESRLGKPAPNASPKTRQSPRIFLGTCLILLGLLFATVALFAEYYLTMTICKREEPRCIYGEAPFADLGELPTPCQCFVVQRVPKKQILIVAPHVPPDFLDFARRHCNGQNLFPTAAVLVSAFGFFYSIVYCANGCWISAGLGDSFSDPVWRLARWLRKSCSDGEMNFEHAGIWMIGMFLGCGLSDFARFIMLKMYCAQ
jgi:hypothetical protein